MKKTKRVKAWAVFCKEGNSGWSPQYDAHFHRSIAIKELKRFKESNSYRTNIYFKIFPVTLSYSVPK